jgi:hypothetical protein
MRVFRHLPSCYRVIRFKKIRYTRANRSGGKDTWSMFHKSKTFILSARLLPSFPPLKKRLGGRRFHTHAVSVWLSPQFYADGSTHAVPRPNTQWPCGKAADCSLCVRVCARNFCFQWWRLNKNALAAPTTTRSTSADRYSNAPCKGTRFISPSRFRFIYIQSSKKIKCCAGERHVVLWATLAPRRDAVCLCTQSSCCWPVACFLRYRRKQRASDMAVPAFVFASLHLVDVEKYD